MRPQEGVEVWGWCEREFPRRRGHPPRLRGPQEDQKGPELLQGLVVSTEVETNC